MTEKPFIHEEAFIDFKTNFIFQEELAIILFKIISLKGILNLGGRSQSVYNFAKKFSSNIKPISRNSVKSFKNYPNISMNIEKLKSIINSQ
jgi:dTDP-4-dehydrorhamnose reductase